MKHLKIIAAMIAGITVFYFLGLYLKDHPKIQNVVPLVFIVGLYFRYESKIEKLSMDLYLVEEQLESLSSGNWDPLRIRGNPFNPN